MEDQWRILVDEARRENGKGNHERAEELVSLAMKEAERMSPDTRSFCSAMGTFALWSYYIRNRADAAERFLSREIDVEKQLGIGERELANMLTLLAEMQQKQGKLKEAERTVRDAIGLYPEGCFPELSVAYDQLASLFEEAGKPNIALEYKAKAADLQTKWDQIVESRQ